MLGSRGWLEDVRRKVDNLLHLTILNAFSHNCPFPHLVSLKNLTWSS
jgi:hypothetical protein